MATLTANERARHVLLVKAAALAEAVVEEHYRFRPELAARYGPAGRRHCFQDTLFHIEFLAASVGIGDSGHFARYVVWCNGLLVSRGIPSSDLTQSLQVMRGVFDAALPTDVAVLARLHIDDAQAALEGAPTTT